MLENANSDKTTVVVGLGSFGQPLLKYLEQDFYVSGIDKDPKKDPEADGTLKNVTHRLISADPESIIMAITSENQATEGVSVLKDLIINTQSAPDAVKTIVQINAVQAPVRTALTEQLPHVIKPNQPISLISLHPNHGPEYFNIEKFNSPKYWILTNIDIIGDQDQDTKEELQRLSVDYIDRLVEKLNDHKHDHIQLVDLTDGYEDEEVTMTGPEYHDYIAAYYQALFHVVRLTPGAADSNWFKDHFRNLKESVELSKLIIKSNPYAKNIMELFQKFMANSTDPQRMLTAAKNVLQHGQTKIPRKFDILKTPNLALLEQI
jgi:prephenate dehydrogenase